MHVNFSIPAQSLCKRIKVFFGFPLSIFDNKLTIFNALYQNDDFLREISAQIEKINISDNKQQNAVKFSFDDSMLLKNMKDKLDYRLGFSKSKTEVDKDQIQEEEEAKSTLSLKESRILLNSLVFSVDSDNSSATSTTLNEEMEKKSILELGFWKNMKKNSSAPQINISFDFRKGFDLFSKELSEGKLSKAFFAAFSASNQSEDLELDFLPQIFRCKTHPTEKTTHFCTKCSRMICYHDFVGPLSCSNHISSIISLSSYEKDMEKAINSNKRDFEKLQRQILEEIPFLEQKKEQNLQNSQKIKDMVHEIEEILVPFSIQFENINKSLKDSKFSEKIDAVDYLKLEKMINLVPKLNEMSEKITQNLQRPEDENSPSKIAAKLSFPQIKQRWELMGKSSPKNFENEKSNSLNYLKNTLNIGDADGENEIEMLIEQHNSEMFEKNSELRLQKQIIANNQLFIQENQLEIESLNSQLQNYSKLEEKTQNIQKNFEKIQNFQAKIRQIEQELPKFSQIIQKLYSPLLNSLQGTQNNHIDAKEIKVALLYAQNEPDMQTVKDSLSASTTNDLNLKIKIISAVCILDSKSEAKISQDSPEIDVFFVWAWGEFPKWCGDFLAAQQNLGKGIIICLGCTCNCSGLSMTTPTKPFGGITGEIEKALPFEKGPLLYNDGPHKLVKVDIGSGNGTHPILFGISEHGFDCGKWSFRAKITQTEGDFDTTISITAACWDDSFETNMIIAKMYHKEQEHKGSIVVLNFWPGSTWWGQTAENKANGDILLQNSVFWAAKEFPGVDYSGDDDSPEIETGVFMSNQTIKVRIYEQQKKMLALHDQMNSIRKEMDLEIEKLISEFNQN